MLKTTLLIAASAMAISSLSAVDATAQDNRSQKRARIVQAAKEAITEDFRNPDGATLRNVTVWNIGGNGPAFNVCGEVNGTNGYGAFVGYRRFSVTILQSGTSLSASGSFLDDPDKPYMAEILDRACDSGRFQPSWRF